MKLVSKVALLGAAVSLAACGGLNGSSNSAAPTASAETEQASDSSIWDIFNNSKPGTTIAVNKYIWNATLEVLNFLPVETVDPFTGVIVTGYGRPPGGGRAYRATVLISDAALEARSLNVALQSRGGAVSTATARAVEDAILARARQLRIQDGQL